MSLSCECYDDYEWFYEGPDDYSVYQRKRRKRCCSCGEMIELGAVCLEFICHRPPRDDIEEKIHGDEVYMANKFTCESCSDIYFSLTELGFCVALESMPEQLEEYQEYKHERGVE